MWKNTVSWLAEHYEWYMKEQIKLNTNVKAISHELEEEKLMLSWKWEKIIFCLEKPSDSRAYISIIFKEKTKSLKIRESGKEEAFPEEKEWDKLKEFEMKKQLLKDMS